MKALSTTILIVVTAVVILVAALVLLSIFGNSLIPVVDSTTQRSICLQQGASTCSVTGNLPTSWFAKMNVRQPGGTTTQQQNCADLTNCQACACLTSTATPA